jgi:glucose/arabinose dehydrogenase/cytochrome c2
MGGGVVPLNGGVLIATGDGRMHFADVSSPSAINVRTLPYRIPVNFDEFSRDTDARTAKHSFRVADIDIDEQAGTLQLLASHHYWDRDRRCFVLRISTATTSSDSLLAGTADLRWRTAFETQPCMLLKSDPTQTPFNGDETGGRMLRLNDGSLLLTVGDVAHDGWNSKVAVAQNPDSHWGKILRINLADGSSELYTVGHRNPQGLVRAGDGRIWATEHGPWGGDELNLVERGSNYGWPRVTLGVDYEQHKWPLSATQGRHAGYPGPVYAWLPSIGVSSLIALQGHAFAEWRGDLLVASLGAGTLYRVRLDGDRVQFAEPMRIGGRIRDLTELPDGRVFMLLDSGDLKTMAPIPEPEEGETSVFFTPVMRGELLFAGCANCHAGDDRGTAPSLAGVVGRTVAAASGYDYSPALRALGGQWSADRIDAFLADPSGYVPGTTMRTAAMRDPGDRRSLIAYLERLR